MTKTLVALVVIAIVLTIVAGVFYLIPTDGGDDCPTVKEIEMSPFMKIPPECEEMN
mgnify:FL=1|tara:strand:- start:410 stop:577 length:168 start_codon:yes stop_codon:yes gene_type:complete